MIYKISRDMMLDIARDRNDGATWAFLGRMYGMNPQTLKRAYLRKSVEVYGDPGAAVAPATSPERAVAEARADLDRARAAGFDVTDWPAPETAAEPVTRPALRDALAANNEAYRTQAITRAEWVARNRELAALGAPLGMTLPAFALADDGLAEAPEAATVVTVLHNIDRDASLGHNTRLTSSHGGRVLPERVEAEPGDRHPLVAVFRFAAEPGETDPALCERAWVAFNESDDALATAYRARRLRSLSVGDVLLVETGDQRRAYACASVGWTRTNLDDLRVVEGAEAVRMIRRRFEFRANERGLAVTVPLDYAGCFHRCLDGAHCGGCGCVGCGYSDTSWPAGVPFGDLTPAQKDAAARRAAAQLETELRANADAIGAAMDAAERDEL